MFNKVDAYSENDIKEVERLKDVYDQVGYMSLKISALKELNIKKISIFTPYTKKINDSVVNYFSKENIIINSLTYLDIVSDLDIGMLYIFAISSLGVYGVIMAGWSSNSKYAFLGALRSTAQMVSYEVSLGLIIITVLMCVGSLNLSEIVLAQEEVWFAVPLFPLLLLFFISCLAETNRAPFDLPEAEAELVAGYNVEYSSMGFALFFLGEYANMIMMSVLCVILFLGGWLPPLSLTIFYWIPGSFWLGIKTIFFLFLYIWVRAAFPRYRYDQLMRLGWKVFLPLALAWVLFVAGILVAFELLP